MGTPSVSVVMSVHNGGRYLRAAADSILRQGYRDFEFLIVDDGSSDDSPAILAGLAAADGRVRLLRRDRRGPGLSVALRDGCAAARGALIARMDADDVAFPDRLQRQVAFLQAHPEIAVVGGALQYLGEAGPLPRILRHPATAEAVRETLPRMNCVAHPTALFRRAAYEEAGGYRAVFRHGEEYDLWLRIADRRGSLANLSEPVLYYRLHPGQISFAHIADQVLHTLAAQAASRRRRAGGADPFEGCDRIVRDDLLSLGLSDAEIDAAVVDRYVTWGNFLAGLGALQDAGLLAEEMRRARLAGKPGRRLAAEADWLAGKVALRQRRLVPAASRLLRALAARPVFALQLARSLTRRPETPP